MFDIDLDWTLDTPAPPTDGQPNAGGGEPPPLATALEEQLGLKLQSTRATVDVLVIDSAKKPNID